MQEIVQFNSAQLKTQSNLSFYKHEKIGHCVTLWVLVHT
jgi:hypothetical protein